MRLHELKNLLTTLNPAAKIGLEGESPKPVISVEVDHDTLKLVVGTQKSAPLTVFSLTQQLKQAPKALLIVDSAGHRLFGFRQADDWLIFK